MKRVLMLGLILGGFSAGSAFGYDWQALPDKAPEPADNPTTAMVRLSFNMRRRV